MGAPAATRVSIFDSSRSPLAMILASFSPASSRMMRTSRRVARDHRYRYGRPERLAEAGGGAGAFESVIGVDQVDGSVSEETCKRSKLRIPKRRPSPQEWAAVREGNAIAVACERVAGAGAASDVGRACTEDTCSGVWARRVPNSMISRPPAAWTMRAALVATAFRSRLRQEVGFGNLLSSAARARS